MPKRPKRRPPKAPSLEFENLVEASATFTSSTRLVENSLDTREEVWRLGFDNGYTILIGSDGRCRVTET